MSKFNSIAFLGTGLMGVHMATNLLKAGFRVSCYNRTQSKTEPVVRAGGTAKSTPREASIDADVIISCVTDGPDVQRVYFGDGQTKDGAIDGARPGTLFVDMSTIAPATSIEIGQRLESRKMRFAEAPITGGTIGAENGTLSILVGSDKTTFDELADVFNAMGKIVTHCGPVGAGQGVKLCNQVMGAMNIWGVCEAFALARGLQIDPSLLEKALGAGAASSWALKNLAPKIAAADWSPGFMIDTQQKDMRLVLDTAENTNTVLPGSALINQLWRASQVYGEGEEGVHALDKVLQRLANRR